MMRLVKKILDSGIAGLVFALGVTAMAAISLAGVSTAEREACEKKAEQVRPALRPGEREAFIANCLADATVDKGKQ